MASVFDKMAALTGLAEGDFDAFISRLPESNPAEIAAVLGYLLGRLDSGDASAMVRVLRKLQPQREINLNDGRATVNIVGTGGGPSTFNITTTTAFVAAAAGAVVVKTGSAASRSKSGFADVAVRLGTLKLSMPWERIEAIAREVGIVFIPPLYYPAALGIFVDRLTQPIHRNVASYLNKVGPLLSPVKVDHRFIGVNSKACLEMLAGACQLLGDMPTTLVSSADGMDEVSTMARSKVVHIGADGRRIDEAIDPGALGIAVPTLEALRGDEPGAAAECCERILGGRGTAAQTEIVALNAGAVLASIGVSSDVSAGYQTALDVVRRGEAVQRLRQLRAAVWNRCADG